MSKKVVIISYATFPGLAPRNLRTHELAKELVKQGNDVTLYVLKGEYDYTQYELETGIRVRSLGNTYFFKYDPSKGMSLNFTMKVLKKLFANFLEFPFIELMLNTFNVLKFEKKIDLLITIAIPYPLHWGAALHKAIYPYKYKHTIWVADCGDPYMGNSFHKKPFYFKYLEKWTFNKVDFISIPIKEAKAGYYPEFHKKIKVIPQGFNFSNVYTIDEYKKNDVPTFIYAGTFYEKLRDPRPFLDYLITLECDFKFIVYTKNLNFLEEYKDKLYGKLEVYSYIPREELIFKMSQADFLLNLDNVSTVHSPSKLIDYALSKRPILNINANIDIDRKLIREFLSGDYKNQLYIQNISQYNISNVARNFLETLDEKK